MQHNSKQPGDAMHPKDFDADSYLLTVGLEQPFTS